MTTAIPSGSIASGIGKKVINTTFSVGGGNYPVRLGIIAQGNTANSYTLFKRKLIPDAVTAGNLYGYGSPIYNAVKVLKDNVLNVGSILIDVFPLEDNLTGTTSTGSIDFVGTQFEKGDYILYIGNVKINFQINSGETGDNLVSRLVNSVFPSYIDLPVTFVIDGVESSKINFESKWAGETADEIGLKIVGDPDGVDFSISNLSGGTNNPSIALALAEIKSTIWNTHLINQFSDESNLVLLDVKGEEFWDSLISKPFVSFFGSSSVDGTNLIINTNNRKTQRTNSKISIPGTTASGIEIASSAATKCVTTADINPPRPYIDTKIYGISYFGEEAEQFSYFDRDSINKGGCSTTYTDGDFLRIADILTTYHPDGDDNPGYRYVVDIAKLQLILFDLDQLFKEDKWEAFILIGDEDFSENKNARAPKDAKTDTNNLAENFWGLQSVIVDAAFTVENTRANINEGNKDRLDMVIPVVLSGAGRIKSLDLLFSTEARG